MNNSTSISMVVYMMLKSLHAIVHRNNFEARNDALSDLITENGVLFFVPVVNVDGFVYISE